MMTLRLQLILAAVLVIGFVVVLNMVRTKSLELKYALSWLVVDVGILIIVLIPGLLGHIANLLGIYNAMNMIFFLGFCFLLVVVFSMTVALSRNSRRIRELAQKMALYEKKIEEQEKDGEDINYHTGV